MGEADIYILHSIKARLLSCRHQPVHRFHSALLSVPTLQPRVVSPKSWHHDFPIFRAYSLFVDIDPTFTGMAQIALLTRRGHASLHGPRREDVGFLVIFRSDLISRVKL